MKSNFKTLANKSVLITGCNRGIGKEILTLFASEGANIFACVRKENPEFTKYINDLKLSCNVKIDILYFDISDESQISKALRDLFKVVKKIDILINNAGIAFGSLLHMTSLNKLKEIFQINFFSHVLITQMVSKLMIRNKDGVIINMGSIAGIDNFAGYTAYGSSKSALMFFTKTIAKELAQYNIRVNSIAPGLVETEMADQMESKAMNDMVSRSNMNRLSKPEEVANLALFLASDRSSFISGQILRIDGGM